MFESSSKAYEYINEVTGKVVSDLLSNEDRDIFLTVDYAIICSTVAMLGVTSNIINIVVFFTQGFSNTVNISFFGLAISDLCCLITLLWMCMFFNPLVKRSGIPWVTQDIMYLPGAWPHVTSGRITSFITVYVTAERCMCIIAPLKVKDIITPSRTFTAVLLIYFFNVLILIPEYATSYYDWTFFPEKNATLLALSFRSNRAQVVGVAYFLNFVTGVTSFIAVIVFTAILIIKFKQTSKWRQEVSSSTGQFGSMSTRDRKTVKMIILIASILVLCYTPGAIFSLTSFVVPEFNLQKGYANIGMALWSIACIFHATNSSVNIFLYYKMSSKYREAFDVIFRRCLCGGNNKVE